MISTGTGFSAFSFGMGISFPSGMKLLQLLKEELGAWVCVNLSRGNRGVAEQLLNRSEIGTAFEQVCRKGVPHRVRVKPFDARPQADFFEDSCKLARSKRANPVCQ